MDRNDVIHQYAVKDLVGQKRFWVDRCLDTECLDDVARQRLTNRCIVEDPVEIGRVPERWVGESAEQDGYRRLFEDLRFNMLAIINT